MKPIFEKRENMGASPLAIATAESILADLKTLPPEYHAMLIAAMVDAAIRKSGAPEMLAALRVLTNQTANLADAVRKFQPLDAAFHTSLERGCAAIAYATRPTP